MTKIELKTRSIYEGLSQSGKKVADYFLSHMEDVFRLPIADLAQESGVSKAAWVRFSKSLGFDGLKDLKKSLFGELHKAPEEIPPVTPFSDIGDAENIEALIASSRANSLRAIESTSALMEPDTIEKAARKILSARSIRIFGVGASGLVGEDLQTKLMRINLHVFWSPDTHMQLSYAASMNHQDVAVLISMSGSTGEILEILKICRTCGTPVLAITGCRKSPLSQGADHLILVSAPEIPLRSGAMSSRIAQLLAVDVLFSATAFLDYDRASEYLKKSSRSLRAHGGQ